MRRNTVAEFWKKVDKTDSCWFWKGGIHLGYGVFYIGRKQFRAHRYAYELCVGPIPEGKDLDHMCHNNDEQCKGGDTCKHRSCVNPDHLVLATDLENVRRAAARKKTCPYGHPYSGYNLILYRNRRMCRACGLRRSSIWQKKSKRWLKRPKRKNAISGNTVTIKQTIMDRCVTMKT